MAKSNTIGCYIHIPFCNKICSYCDFCKVFYKEELVDKYLEELEREIEDSYNEEEIDTIYIGGGTPSSLNLSQLEKLFNIVKKLNINNLLEYTIECNFDSITEEKLDLFKSNKVNRISFGLESINKDNLKLLERKIDKNKVIDTINYCHNIGIDNINVDLMYALPDESLEVLEKDIDFIKSLDITHISTYSLILEEHTKLSINNTKYIDEDLDREMYDLICNKLSDYDHYEISNFAKSKEYRSKHNMKYWKNKEYYGFGLGAAGYEGNVRYNKTKSITKYLNSDYMMDNGIEILELHDKVYYEVIMNLRTSDGIDLIDFKNKYNKELKDYYDYSSLVEEKIIKLENNRLVIPENLWYISNSVIVKLLDSEVIK